MKPIKCKVCSFEFVPAYTNHYVSRDEVERGVVAAFKSSEEPKIYDTFDCPVCGCQIVAQERKYKLNKNNNVDKENEENEDDKENEEDSNDCDSDNSNDDYNSCCFSKAEGKTFDLIKLLDEVSKDLGGTWYHLKPEVKKVKLKEYLEKVYKE